MVQENRLSGSLSTETEFIEIYIVQYHVAI